MSFELFCLLFTVYNVPMKLFITLPAFNEGKIIAKVLKGLPSKIDGIDKIQVVVINDGSTDNTLSELKRFPKVKVISHMVNRGLGAALNTGFLYARKNGADILVTIDADGQHDPRDIEKIIKPILQKKADTVIGSRLKNPEDMPWYRIIGNFGLNLATYLFFGAWTTDSQSGIRAFSAKALKVINIKSDRMEVSSEIIREIGLKKLKVAEVPVKAIYSKYSLDKGQKNTNIFNIIFKMIWRGFND